MNNIKKNKFTENAGLILHKKTEDGNNNTFLVKPHKSGDLNSYTFEEVKRGLRNSKNVAVAVTETVSIGIGDEKQKFLNNRKPKLVNTTIKKQDIKPTIRIKAVTRQSNTPVGLNIKHDALVGQKTVIAKQTTNNFPKVTPVNLTQKMAIARQTKISPGNVNVLKRGLLIGINYTGSDNHLDECINNCENIRNFLVQVNS